MHRYTYKMQKSAAKGRTVYRMDFESYGEYHRYCVDKGYKFGQGSWTDGSHTANLALSKKGGDRRLASKMVDMSKKLDIPSMDAWAEQPVNTMVGMPLVPAVIAGLPNSSIAMSEQQVSDKPVRIWASLSSSAGVGTDVLATRGCALLALVKELSKVRPVDLYAVITLDADRGKSAFVITIPVPTRPLNLAAAGMIFAHQGLPRGTGMSLGSKEYRFQGSWFFNDLRHEIQRAGVWLPEVIYGMLPDANDQDGDIVLPPIYLSDPLIRDPQEWLQRTFNDYTIGKWA